MHVRLRGDSDLDKTFKQGERAAGSFEKKIGAVFKKYDGRKLAVGVEERGAASAAASLKAVDEVADRLDGRDVAVDVNADEKGIRSLGSAFGELSSGIRNTGTVLRASAIPLGIAAVGAGVPTVTALASSFAGLALNVGKAGAGLAAIGGVAGGGAYAGLAAYTKLLSSTVTASREAYTATHEHRMELLEKRKQEILSTNASKAFNREIDESSVRLTRLQAAVGNRAFPHFTGELDHWNEILDANQGKLAGTAGEVARIAAGFSEFFRTAQQGQVLARTLDFVNRSALTGASVVHNLGKTGVMAIQPMIPLASKLQDEMSLAANAAAEWAESAEGQKRLAAIYRDLDAEMRRTGRTVLDLGRGFVGLFDSIDRAGLSDQASRGLATLASGFASATRRGTESRRTLDGFMADVKGLMPYVGSLGRTVWSQFSRVARVLISARQEGSKLTILQSTLRGIQGAVKPVANLLISTTKALGPELGPLVSNFAKLAETFAGSSGPLVLYVQTANRLMTAFNSLSPGTKTLVANMVALKLIVGTIGLGGLISGAGRLAAQYWAMSRASKASALAVAQSNTALKASAGANVAAGASSAAAAGKVGLLSRAGIALRGAFAAVGVALAGVSLPVVAAGAAIAGVAYLIYRNWDRVKAAGAALVSWYTRNFPKTSATIAQVFNRAKQLASQFAQGGLRLVVRAGSAVVRWFVSHWPQINRVLVAGGRIFGRTLSAMTAPLRLLIRGAVAVVSWFARNWDKILKTAQTVAGGVSRTLSGMKNGAVRWVHSLVGAVVNFWKTSVFGAMATFLVQKANGMVQTLSNWKGKAASWVSSLVGAILTPWKSRTWQPAADFLVEKSTGMLQTLSNWKNKAVSWVSSLGQAIGKPFASVWQAMADVVVEKKDGMLQTVSNLSSGIVDGFTAIVGFINKVLSAVNLPTIKLEGSQSGNQNPKTDQQNRQTNFARGGVWDPPARYASGGVWVADRGGVGDGKTIGAITNEAGDREAIVNLDRRTPESQVAFREAARSPNAGSREEHQRAHRHGRMRKFAAGGVWTPGVAGVNSEIESKFGVSGSTYAGHGRHGDAALSIDWVMPSGWGVDASGSSKAKGDSIVSHLVSNWDKFSTEYLIWYRMMKESKDGGWFQYTGGGGYAPPSGPSGFHTDHVHYSSTQQWNGGESLTGGGGGGSPITSLWDSAGEAVWNRLVQPAVDRLAGSFGPSIFGDIGGALVKNTATKIKDWIIGEAGSSGGSGSGNWSGGGSVKEWVTEGLKVGGAFPASSSNVSKMEGRAMQESGGDPKAVNDWDSNAAAGTPSKGLMQVIEPTWNSNTTGSIGPFDSNWDNPIKSAAVASRYMKSAYGYVVGPTGSGYARGGIAGGPEVSMPPTVSRAFVTVAATLGRMARKSGFVGSPGSGLKTMPGGGIADDLIGIAGEDGPESIVPLRRQTPEGRRALHVGMRRYGIQGYASGGVTGQSWNLVGGDAALGINGPAAGEAIAAGNRFWGGAGIRFGPGSDVYAEWADGIAAGSTSTAGRMRVDRQFMGTAIAPYLWGHEDGHAVGAGHSANDLMGSTVSVGETVSSSTLAAVRRLHGGPVSPHGDNASSTGAPRGGFGSGSGAGGGSSQSQSIRLSGGGSANSFQSQGGSEQGDKEALRQAMGAFRGVRGFGLLRDAVRGWAGGGKGPGANGGKDVEAGRDSADLKKLGDRLEKKLDQQLKKMVDADDLVRTALAAVESPAGKKAHERNSEKHMGRLLGRKR